MQIYIKHLAKDILLFKLWEAARNSPNFYYCKDTCPVLTPKLTKKDINYMISNDRKIDITTYYGRMLYIDISNDYTDVFMYEIYNGQGSAENVIRQLKKQELEKAICTFYKFF